MRWNTTIIGKKAERIAEQDYIERGYEIVAKNFRCHLGEIDLIAYRDGEMIVAEVKSRRVFSLDDAWITRWYRKKARLSRTLRWFLAGHQEWVHCTDQYRLEIIFITQGRVWERYTDEPYRG